MTRVRVSGLAGGASAPLVVEGAARYAAYVRVSTALQGDSGLGLEAQERAIQEYAGRHDVLVVETVREVVSGGSAVLPVRDGLISRCRAGDLDGVIVAKLDRLSRSTAGLLSIAADAEKHGFTVIIVDQGIMLPGTSASERMFCGMLAVFAEFERNLIAERTREGLAAARARGTVLGRRSVLDPRSVQRIRDLAGTGHGTSSIAHVLNADGLPSASGKPWRHSMVAEVIRRNA